MEKRISIADILYPELLSTIFVYCLPDESHPRPSIKNVPLCLGRVCSSWRNVANSTPQLWAEIEFVIEEGMKFTAVAFEDWIRKSGNLPISVFIADNRSIDTVDDGKMDGTILAFIDSICTYSQRWRSLVLKGEAENFPGLQKILRVFSTSAGLPLLEELKIQFPYLDSNLAEDLTLDCSSCPTNALTRFDFYINTPNPFSRNWTFSSSKIRDLTLPFTLPLEGVIHYLRRTPSVETLSFAINYRDSDEDDEDIIVSLPNLTNLSIEFGNENDEWGLDLGPLFSKLNTPALETVNFDLWNCVLEDDPPDWTPFAQLLARSTPPLTSIAIRADVVDNVMDGWIECLKHATLLRQFSLEYNRDDGDATPIFRALSSSSSSSQSPLVCPYLEELHIKCCANSSIDFVDPFIEMLRTRLNHKDPNSVKLHEVHIVVYNGFDILRFSEAHMIEFQTYRKIGLNLTMTLGPG